jgi:signal transduction histidine kinase
MNQAKHESPEEQIERLQREIAQLRVSLEGKVQERTQQLERAKKEWEHTFDAIGEPVVLLGPDYEIKRANIALAKRVQKDIRSLIGKACHKELMGRDTPCDNCPLQGTLDSTEGQLAEITHANQRTIYRLRSFAIPNRSDQVVHTYHDITEEKEYQKLLIQAEKLNHIGMLAAQVAHEINNPLASILSQAQLLLLDLDTIDPASLEQALREMEKAALRCRSITLNLLNFSRPAPVDRKARQSVNKVIQQALPIFRLMPPKQGPHVNIMLGPDLHTLMLDPNKLQSALLNLLGNAKAATPPEGQITLETYQQDNHILIVVSDTGPGIPPDMQEKIFAPFFTTKPQGLGTGLGLYITQEVVQEHGGEIILESEPGKGTTFTIRLPIQF